MIWAKDIKSSPGRIIFVSSENTSIEIEWWQVGGTDDASPRCCAIELYYFTSLNQGSHTESFYFDRYSTCLQIIDELVDCFTDNVKREELLNTLRVKEVL